MLSSQSCIIFAFENAFNLCITLIPNEATEGKSINQQLFYSQSAVDLRCCSCGDCKRAAARKCNNNNINILSKKWKEHKVRKKTRENRHKNRRWRHVRDWWRGEWALKQPTVKKFRCESECGKCNLLINVMTSRWLSVYNADDAATTITLLWLMMLIMMLLMLLGNKKSEI